MVNSKSFIVVILQLVQTLLAAVITIYVARLLGAAGYGDYIFLTTATSLLAVFAGLGSEHVFIMEGSRAARLVPVFFGNAFATRLIISAAIFLAICLYIYFVPAENSAVPLLITAGSLIALFPALLFMAYYRVIGVYIRPYILSFLNPLLFISILAFNHNSQTLESVSWGFFLSNAITFLVFLVDMRKTVRMIFSARYVKRFFRKGLVFSVSQGFDFAFARLDIFILQYAAGPVAVGIYAAGQRVVSLFQLIPSSFHVVELPEFHRAAGDAGLLESKFRQLRKMLLEIGLLIFGGLILNATSIINILFGNTYAGAEDVVVLLSIAGLLMFVAYPYYMIAEAMNRITQRLFIRIATFVATALFVYLFLYYFGVQGAAAGLVAGQLVFMVLLHWLTSAGNGGVAALMVDYQILIVSAIFFVVSWWIQGMFNDQLSGGVIATLIFVAGTMITASIKGISIVSLTFRFQYKRLSAKFLR